MSFSFLVTIITLSGLLRNTYKWTVFTEIIRRLGFGRDSIFRIQNSISEKIEVSSESQGWYCGPLLF